MYSISVKNFNDFIFCPNSTFLKLVAYEDTKKGKDTKERMVKQELRRIESQNGPGWKRTLGINYSSPSAMGRHTSRYIRLHPTWS